MKTFSSLSLGTALCGFLAAVNPSFAQGTAFTYQGRLNNNGVSASGIYDLRVTIYDSIGGPTVVAGPLTNTAVGVNNGLFTVTLDFGTTPFTGPARWLDIAVRTNGPGSFSPLTPRQALTPSPYAIFAGTATNVVSGTVVKSLNNLKDNVTLAAGANVTLTPSGNTVTIASTGTGGNGIWNLDGTNAYYNSGNVGIGTTAPGTALEANGIVRSTRIGNAAQYVQLDGGDPSSIRLTAQSIAGAEKNLIIQNLTGDAISGANNNIEFALGPPSAVSTKMTLTKDGDLILVPGGSGGAIEFGSPNTETGMSIVGVNRADIRFDGLTLKMIANPGTGIPPSGTGIAVNTSGNVGIGTISPAHRLSLIGGPFWTDSLWLGALELGNTSAIGWQANAGGQRFGIGQSTGGLYFFRTASNPGNTGSPATIDVGITDSGNLEQARDKGGLVKAMVYVNADATIARCYNGIANSFSGNCGFSVSRPTVGNHTVYRIDLGFPVSDRFFSVTTHARSANVSANCSANPGNANQVDVDPFLTDVDYVNSEAHTDFTLFIY